ncbi:MAG: autotransporter outer membrane beta-barrel domain-containing protein [Granulosicoccus sp.]
MILAWLLLIGGYSGVNAQTFELPLSIIHISSEVMNARVNERIEDITVAVNDQLLPAEAQARVHWRIEPADAARLETAPTTYFSPETDYIETSTTITVLKPTTFYLIARGLYDSPGFDAPVNAQSRAVPDLEFNELAFTIDATGDTESPEPPITAALTSNQIQARDGALTACSSVQSLQDPSNAQQNLLTHCSSLMDAPAGTLDRLVPDELFAIGDAIVEFTQSQTANLYARLDRVRAGTDVPIDFQAIKPQIAGVSLNVPVLAAAKPTVDDATDHGSSDTSGSDNLLGVFAAGRVSIGAIDGDGIQQDARIRSQGLTVGADYRLNPQVVIGAGVGLVNNDTDFEGDDGDLKAEGMSLNLFATWYEADQGYADIILDVGRSNFELQRRINLPGDPGEFARGSTDASHITIAVSAGRTFSNGPWSFGPTMRLHLTSASVDAFEETSSLDNGGSGTALTVAAHNVKSTRMAVGADIRRAISTRWAVLIPTFRAELALENENERDEIEASFVHDPAGAPMRFNGTDRDNSYLNLSFGSTVMLANNKSAFAFYETRTQNDFVSQQWLQLGVRLNF